MPSAEQRLGIFYEHPDWYRPLFDELDRRGVPYDALHAGAHRYDPADAASPHRRRPQPHEPLGVPPRAAAMRSSTRCSTSRISIGSACA